LANFGTGYYGIDYTSIASTGYATVNGATGTIGSFGSAVYELLMVTTSLTVKAQPSALTSDGESFSVAWKHS
jgi:type II secretory pathway component GspD/PulD (secretin)